MGLSDFLKLTKQVDHKTINSNQFFSFCLITPGAFHPFVSVFFFKSLFYLLLLNFLGLPRIPVALFQLHAVIYITTDIYIFMTISSQKIRKEPFTCFLTVSSMNAGLGVVVTQCRGKECRDVVWVTQGGVCLNFLFTC